MDEMVKRLVTGIIFLIVGIVIVFNILGATAPTLISAANQVNSSGLPLSSLYSNNGVILLILMAGILVALVVGTFMIFKGGK